MIARVLDSLVDKTRGRRCIKCGERVRDQFIAEHYRWEHAGDRR